MEDAGSTSTPNEQRLTDPLHRLGMRFGPPTHPGQSAHSIAPAAEGDSEGDWTEAHRIPWARGVVSIGRPTPAG